MDVVYKFKPEKDGEPGEMGVQFKAEDLIEKKILSNLVALAMDSNVKQVLFGSNDTAHQKFIGSIFDLTQNLFNANSHRRQYKMKQKIEIKKFKKTVQKDRNKNIDLVENPTELWVEVNGLLTALKSSLDSLAICIEPFIGKSLHGWHKIKDDDGIEKSGLNIVRVLKRNIPKEQQAAVQPLIKLIEEWMTWITYLVELRDSPVHHGGLKNVSGLRFKRADKKIEAQMITHKNGSVESVEDFNKRTMEFIVGFSTKVVLAAIHAKVPALALVRVNGVNGGRFSWAPRGKV